MLLLETKTEGRVILIYFCLLAIYFVVGDDCVPVE